MFSERSDRASKAGGTLGDGATRAEIAAIVRVDPDRIAIAPSVAAIHLALFYVLADPGDELIMLPSADPIASEVAAVSGLAVTEQTELDAESLFEMASERTRVIALGDDDAVDLLAELDVSLLARAPLLVGHPIFETEHAPLAVVIGVHETNAWLAVLGPEDRAGSLLAKLEAFAHVFFARLA